MNSREKNLMRGKGVKGKEETWGRGGGRRNEKVGSHLLLLFVCFNGERVEY